MVLVVIVGRTVHFNTRIQTAINYFSNSDIECWSTKNSGRPMGNLSNFVQLSSQDTKQEVRPGKKVCFFFVTIHLFLLHDWTTRYPVYETRADTVCSSGLTNVDSLIKKRVRTKTQTSKVSVWFYLQVNSPICLVSVHNLQNIWHE